MASKRPPKGSCVFFFRDKYHDACTDPLGDWPTPYGSPLEGSASCTGCPRFRAAEFEVAHTESLREGAWVPRLDLRQAFQAGPGRRGSYVGLRATRSLG